MSQYEFRKAIDLALMHPKNYWKSNNRKEPMMWVSSARIFNKRAKKSKNPYIRNMLMAREN